MLRRRASMRLTQVKYVHYTEAQRGSMIANQDGSGTVVRSRTRVDTEYKDGKTDVPAQYVIHMTDCDASDYHFYTLTWERWCRYGVEDFDAAVKTLRALSPSGYRFNQVVPSQSGSHRNDGQNIIHFNSIEDAKQVAKHMDQMLKGKRID